MRILAVSLVVLAVVPIARAAPPERWEHVHRWLGEQRDGMAADLESAHALLLERAIALDDAATIARLDEPPRPRPRGYGVLPEIKEDRPVAPIELREKIYALETLGRDFSGRLRDAAVLADRVAAEPQLPLETQVEEFDRLRKAMRNLEDHLAYHAKWQVEIVEHRAFFEQRNDVVERARRMADLLKADAAAAEIDTLRAQVLRKVAPFVRTTGLRLVEAPDGRRVLPVTVATDIEDDAFLDTFAEAVAEAFEHSEAARARRFAVELSWERIAPETLYPEGPPERGAVVDMKDHRARFPARALVLTSGAASTHARKGRSILLGPSPLHRRALAHEFGHLLGFADAYLRGFEGEPGGPYGLVVVEWIGLQDDLMGSPAAGRVTAAMIERLIQAYGPR